MSEKSIWDKGIYGMVFDGNEVDLQAYAKPCDHKTKFVIFRISGGGGKRY